MPKIGLLTNILFMLSLEKSSLNFLFMSEQYRLMIYFAVATMYFYRKDIVSIEDGETLGSFAEKNKLLIDKVISEAKTYFNYELSSEQIGKAIKAYLAEPAPLLRSTEYRPSQKMLDLGDCSIYFDGSGHFYSQSNA